MAKARKNKKRNIKPVLIALLGVVGLAAAALIYWYLSLKAPVLPSPPLKELAAERKVDLGIHVLSKRLGDRVYPDLVSSQFSFVTIDGGIHFKQLHPTPDKNDFSQADKIVEFAEAHGMPVQLHHLVWGDDYMLPKWLTEGNYTKKQLVDILHKHINAVVERYKGRVKEYTVVNEAFTENKNVYGLENWWAQHIGNDPKYMDDYFKWAHAADPDAKLILNDFNNETKNTVSDAMYDYIKAAKARGVPIDGVGVQLHVDAARSPDKQDIIDNMNRFEAIGVKVYVTEFDVNTNAVKDSVANKSRLEAKITYDMARACIESKTCASFTVFGLTAQNDLFKKLTRENSRDYMFDSRFRPRESFYSFRQAWLDPQIKMDQ